MFSAVYEEDVDNDEQETLKVEDKPQANKKDGYKGQTPFTISEVIEPRGTISYENSSAQQVSRENEEEWQEQRSVSDETARGTQSSEQMGNLPLPIDILLMPVANISMDASSDDEFFEDSRGTKGSEQLNLEAIPFLTRSQK
jgi:hypothetical protein